MSYVTIKVPDGLQSSPGLFLMNYNNRLVLCVPLFSDEILSPWPPKPHQAPATTTRAKRTSTRRKTATVKASEGQ